MAETIFEKIVRGEMPCHKIYEDESVLAFLDISPLSRGHTLVIPKEAATSLDELSDDASAAVGRALPRICRALKKIVDVQHFNILQNNGILAHQAVFHVHFHIIPKPNENEGLGIKWPAGHLKEEDAKELAASLRAEINSPKV